MFKIKNEKVFPKIIFIKEVISLLMQKYQLLQIFNFYKYVLKTN
jgi:hypothetical protein